MGVKKLKNIMKDTTKAAGISGETNYSGRKTLVQKLQHSGVPPNQIIQITGHTNLQLVKITVLCEKSKWKVFHLFFPRRT